ncbi:DUF2470 domain-containing protein [Amnibacterium flavum]|uniref:DUF2470 domain-containing protein n=1 Tax=Amnibacterium flavum TaxID=2173173 RepID=A0A2V1HWD5_9MICO|nr:DUF2470 domain-containing protein [Amnibacterium flavum]PVZ95440.1 hypothetical protein DDQ50_02730 [Amnibacterium flavum]
MSAVLRHMNADHNTDSLVIVRANGAPSASRATMTGLDGERGIWRVVEPEGERELVIPWSRPISERPEIRREIVALHEDALASSAPLE